MARYFVRRMGYAVFVIFIMSIISFVIIQFEFTVEGGHLAKCWLAEGIENER